MMQTVLGNSTKVLVDQKAGGNLLYLPLDRLIQGATAAAAAAADSPAAPRPVTPAPAEAGASVDPGHSRDALRNRER
jgi:membrane protease subunit HflK